ncbi:MAG: hypothetical protein A2992_01020 [Elusimicrobia bacterium RIFCSPLOWO2_01_FULL_59_12]|nr:MAG: hypothetical protein A2992_01020 [Elusimicrobia bacterium RIFCSPLOWO2_01_FULL_59_12]
MSATNAVLALFGDSFPILVTRSGEGVYITDENGQPITLPDGVAVDLSSGNLYQDNEIVGNITGFDFSTLTSDFNEETTPSSALGGGASPFSSTSGTNGGGAGASSDPNNGVGPTGTVSGRPYATATLTDGGARPVIVEPAEPTAPAPPKTPTTTAPPNTPTPPPDTEDPPTEEPPPVDTTAAVPPGSGSPSVPGTGSGVPDDTGYKGFHPGPGPSKMGSILGAFGSFFAMGVRGQWFSHVKNSGLGGPTWFRSNALGKASGVVGLVLGGWSVFDGAFRLFSDGFSMGALGEVISGVGMYAAGLWQLGLLSNPYGWIALAAAFAIAAIWGYIMGKRDNKLDTARADAARMPNAGPWYSSLPANAVNNVFMIALGGALMGIGLDLSVSGPIIDSVKVSAVDLPSHRDVIKGSIRQADVARFPTNPTGLLGKVFIQSAENNGMTPDKIVFVDEDPDPGVENGYRTNLVAVDWDNDYVGDLPPGTQRLPMFQATSNGAIVANPYASSALSEMMAMAQAANASGISPRGATGALRNGGAAGGGAIPVIKRTPEPPDNPADVPTF